jgi:succinoglycan biosynthesis transport protein ExoP
VELMNYLLIARKYWRSIVAIVLLTVIAAGLFSLLSKRTYTATTSIFLSVVSVANTASELSAGAGYAQTQVKSLALVATAPITLQPVINSLGLDTTPEELAKNVTATVPASTAVIDLAVTNGDPAQAARIANALGEQIIAAVKQLTPSSANGGQSVVATIIRPAVAPTSPTTPRTAQNLGRFNLDPPTLIRG